MMQKKQREKKERGKNNFQMSKLVAAAAVWLE
jgi:hypothetical protein